ncbi:MAG: YifB family Mg chelatase-like AAA ATPase [Pigmentiphaga sp.]|uniref:YifB family Mg chelatase-like AAA ATPase n=1 Tax=Pigmentiphaga sp. TaxID=1977564 RepID=UPI0029AB5155|nr:YifB family Mg chelatase-like AAA ATPase [Pigmentiphaga sp.]MDX3906331.1 YifB family Mg chelatase-like AAA ATPase [Pigmentiphaga sp.]
MTLAVLASCALTGIDAPPVRVEVHLAPGLPSFTMVGLADTEVRESRERVRAALLSSGYEFPAGRVTVNLAPADLPKESGRFDLPIAVGVLLASGQIAMPALKGRKRPSSPLARWVLAGELSLTGALVPIAGALAIGLSLSRRQPDADLLLPAASAAQAARVPGLRVYGAATLQEVVAHLEEKCMLTATASQAEATACTPPCLSDVRGQYGARRALEVAAGGGHNLLMLGPPGSGKSMLAQRLPGLLPPLRHDEALEAAAIAGLAPGAPPPFGLRPFRAPHHSISGAALVGGGSRPRPGEITFAHLGVLFLDELPEFGRHVLDTLREPLETGRVSIARALHRTDYPARFQLVAAMNPCRCGWHGSTVKACSCTPDQVAAYRSRLSGPLLDRIDLQVEVPAAGDDWTDLPPGEPTAEVRRRVEATLDRQLHRQGCTNAALLPGQVDVHCRADTAARALWKQSMKQFAWSARTAHRVLKVARTIADLAGAAEIGSIHMAEAVQFRRPLRER